MTHKDIYMKLTVEYNKLTENNSLSLTEYDAAVALDKAYNSIIAQKMTGNNIRRSMFESDIKSISDLSPLISTKKIDIANADTVAKNVKQGDLPTDFLYFINASSLAAIDDTPMDETPERRIDFRLIDHETAKRFFASVYNAPWIKIPVCYMENGKLYIVYDLYDYNNSISMVNKADITYIKKPNTFVKNLESIMNNIILHDRQDADSVKSLSYFNYDLSGQIDYDLNKLYTFECNNTVAEEVISLAIAFLLENTESNRLNNKLNMRGLEA